MLLQKLQLPTALSPCPVRQRPVFRPCREPRLSVRCAVSKSRSPARRQSKGAGAKGGFGKSKNSRPALEPWEEDLAPSYRVYYKPTFKPGRFLGPVVFKRDSEDTGHAYLEEDVLGAQLLAICHPLCFLQGELCKPPAVEDLHVSLLEDPPSPQIQKVLQLLPRRPPAKQKQQQQDQKNKEVHQQRLGAAADAAAPVATTSSSGASSSTTSSSGSQEVVVTPMASTISSSGSPSSSSSSSSEAPEQVSVAWEKLDPRSYSPEQLSELKALGSGPLMRTLQRSSWSEEYQDAASSQVRHERPAGFIGVWPEQAFLGHSCAPNTSVVVVNRYLLIHATDDLPSGAELTSNKIGRDIISPFATRQQAVQAMTGRPCGCDRCRAEQLVPQEVQQQLQEVYASCGGRWGAAMQEGIMSQDTEALGELQADIFTELSELEGKLGEVPDLDVEQRQLVRAAVYDAYDMVWQLEEMIEEEPDLALLEECVELMKVFGRGTESHVYAATTLYQMLQVRAEGMMAAAGAKKRRTAAAERRLVKEVQQLSEQIAAAEVAFLMAMYTRYGYIGDQGLLPQLVQGLSLFYAGLRQMSAGEEEGEAGPVVREMDLQGIPVTVVDTVDGISQESEVSSSNGDLGVSMRNPKEAGTLKVQFLEDAASVQTGDASGKVEGGGEQDEQQLQTLGK